MNIECVKCHRSLPPSKFYIHWGEQCPKKCRKCYREDVNEQKLRAAIDSGNILKVERIRKHRQEMSSRPDAIDGHAWCGKCKRWRPFNEFSKRSLLEWNWCRDCSSSYSVRRNMFLKKKAIEYLGGKCDRCGWSGHWAGFEFHHRIPGEKEFMWNTMKKWSWDRLLPELKKTRLLCGNCHAIIHCSMDNDGNINPEYEPTNIGNNDRIDVSADELKRLSEVGSGRGKKKW